MRLPNETYNRQDWPRQVRGSLQDAKKRIDGLESRVATAEGVLDLDGDGVLTQQELLDLDGNP